MIFKNILFENIFCSGDYVLMDMTKKRSCSLPALKKGLFPIQKNNTFILETNTKSPENNNNDCANPRSKTGSPLPDISENVDTNHFFNKVQRKHSIYDRPGNLIRPVYENLFLCEYCKTPLNLLTRIDLVAEENLKLRSEFDNLKSLFERKLADMSHCVFMQTSEMIENYVQLKINCAETYLGSKKEMQKKEKPNKGSFKSKK